MPSDLQVAGQEKIKDDQHKKGSVAALPFFNSYGISSILATFIIPVFSHCAILYKLYHLVFIYEIGSLDYYANNHLHL